MATPVVSSPTSAPAISAAVFQQDCFLARQKVFSFTPKFYFCDQNGSVLAFLRKKVFTLKDEIRVFTDETQSFELLRIKGRQIIDFGAAFDVMDSINNERVGTLKRRGWKSLVRKEWTILDAREKEIGRFKEDSLMLAMLRRFITSLIPQEYTFELEGRQIGTARQNWNFFAPKMQVDFSGDPGRKFDRRLAAAAIILLLAVEGRQQQYD